MRALLVSLLAPALLCAPALAAEPDREASDPASAAEAAEEELPALRLQGCRDRFSRGDVAGARVCYETGPDAAMGRRVADSLARAQGFQQEAGPTAGQRLSDYVLGGRAELVATSAAYGVYLGVLADWTAAGAIQSSGVFISDALLGTALLGTAVLVPVATGSVALAGTAVATWVLDGMTPGQANLVRASLWLAAFDASLGTVMLTDRVIRFGGSAWNRHLPLLTGVSQLGINAAVLGGAVAAAALLPERFLPASAGSLGLSLGSYAATLTLLGLAMGRFETLVPFDQIALFTLTTNLGFLGGVALAPFVPIGRYETWLMDGGAVVGGLLATAIVIGARAGNPVAGYGGIGAGLLVGAGGALVVGKLVPIGLDALPLPDLVAVAPMVVPPAGASTTPGFGVSVGVDVDQLFAR